MIAGIDFGSKLAGTTVLAWFDGQSVALQQSAKGADADALLEKWVAEKQIKQIFMDAPLSLPGVYTGEGSDYFYRAGDRALGAMSPLFLGGLTARAMRLVAGWRKAGVEVFEAYPGALWKEIGDKKRAYKKDLGDLPGCVALLQEHWKVKLPEVANWHQFDALMALTTGLRYQERTVKIHGDPQEGSIYV